MADDGPGRSSAETPAPSPAPAPDTLPRARPPATVSSLKSEDSTEQLICKTPQKVKKQKTKEQSVASKSVGRAGGGGRGRRRLVVALGLAQVVLGALLVGAGALAAVRGAALARAGAGLWAGGVAVVAGVVGALAGVSDCSALGRPAVTAGAAGGPFLTAFLALSLLSLACGNGAAVLAATGLHRDAHHHAHTPLALTTFEDEMEAWTPVLANIAVLLIACAQCVASAVAVYHVSRRVCPCLRPRRPYDHNQFQPAAAVHQQPYVVHVDESKPHDAEKIRNHELCQELEVKLQGETVKKKQEEPPEYGSANSKEKLVTRWLGHHAGAPVGAARGGAGRARRAPPAPAAEGVRKARARAPVVLLPAHPASTLGRMPPQCVLLPPRYATLPLPPAPYAHPHAPHHAPHHAPIYYPLHDTRVRRRRPPREYGRGERRRGRREARGRDSQLTRSLERIHRKRRAGGAGGAGGAERDRVTDADLKRTYTGLDRAYAEQFIAVCDETRHAHAHAHAAAGEQHDSLASTSATSDTSHTS